MKVLAGLVTNQVIAIVLIIIFLPVAFLAFLEAFSRGRRKAGRFFRLAWFCVIWAFLLSLIAFLVRTCAPVYDQPASTEPHTQIVVLVELWGAATGSVNILADGLKVATERKILVRQQQSYPCLIAVQYSARLQPGRQELLFAFSGHANKLGFDVGVSALDTGEIEVEADARAGSTMYYHLFVGTRLGLFKLSSKYDYKKLLEELEETKDNKDAIYDRRVMHEGLSF